MKPLFIILFTIFSFSLSAQSLLAGDGNKNDQVNWKFSISKVENKYTIDATAYLENGWHIFSSNPGGDGSLTPTQIEVNEIQKLKIPVEFGEESNWIEKDMEGIGPVKYFEKKASFRITFTPPANIKTFTGNISYQICNEVMCMAPTTKSFTVTVK